MSNTLGDMGVAAGLAGGVGDFGGGVGSRSSARGELASDCVGRNKGVVEPSAMVGSIRGETGADETVVAGSGAGDIAAGDSWAGDTVAAGSAAGETVVVGSGAGVEGADMFK